MGEPRSIDWEGVEREYRAGLLSLREIGAHFGLTHAAIRKRAEKDGWSRDLAAKIRAKAEALVSKDAVSSSVSMDTAVSEKEIVEANALVVANVDRRHKETAKRGQALVDQLLAEVGSTTENIELFEQLGEMLDKTETTESGRVIEDKLNKLYRAVISMGGRVDSLKKLAETFEKFAKFERLAYRLEDGAPPDDGAADASPDRVADGVRRLAYILSRASAPA